MHPPSSYDHLAQAFLRIHRLDHLQQIVGWDQATFMPPGGAEARGAALGEKGVPVVNRFFARVSASTGEPELYCEGNGKTGSAQPLVEGVERVRIRYWLAGASAAIDASVAAS